MGEMNPEFSELFLGGFATSHQGSVSCSGSMENKRMGWFLMTAPGTAWWKQAKLQLDQTKVQKYYFSWADNVFDY